MKIRNTKKREAPTLTVDPERLEEFTDVPSPSSASELTATWVSKSCS